jgi:hypothetical protein
MGIGTGLLTGLPANQQARNDEKNDKNRRKTTFTGAGDGNRTRVISLEG